jgi:HD-GYP domain-containing protein (c-di-GMP phosphodiesterase class II)
MMVLYIYVSMADYMQQERVKELVKRRKVQEDFTNVVTKIFDVTLKGNTISEDEKRDMTIVSSMSSKLASLLSYDPNTCEEIYNYSKITVTKNVDFHIDENISEDEKFAFLSKQTELGSSIISRLQLSRKCEDIIRATLEGGNDESFMENQKKIQNNPESQIILICEMYVTMRGIRSYKRPYNHQKTITFMESELKPYFDNIIFERFIRFQDDFESLYNDM